MRLYIDVLFFFLYIDVSNVASVRHFGKIFQCTSINNTLLIHALITRGY